MPTPIVLPADQAGEVIDVFADAFHDYPVMRFVVGPDDDVDARVRRLITLFVTRRVLRGGPMFGMFDGDRLVGAAILALPVEPELPPDKAAVAAELAEHAWRDLGEPARARYQTYADTASRFFSDIGPHHHLNMIGVRRSHAGLGLARPLLDAVARLAAGDAASAGVSLTTERPRNVALYEHFGYRVVAHGEVTPGFESWGLFTAPRRP
jgi:GNAT superfamily N-acetyltransferase